MLYNLVNCRSVSFSISLVWTHFGFTTPLTKTTSTFSPLAGDDIFHDKKVTFACLVTAVAQFIARNSGASPPLAIFTSFFLVLTESTLSGGRSPEKCELVTMKNCRMEGFFYTISRTPMENWGLLSKRGYHLLQRTLHFVPLQGREIRW